VPNASFGGISFSKSLRRPACELERTPLTRCGQFADYMKQDQKLNANYKALMKSLLR